MVYNLFSQIDPRGQLVAIEQHQHCPFEIKRVFFIADVPPGKSRGRHSHKECQQMIIAAAGEFTLILDTEEIPMFDPREGIFVPRRAYIELKDFTPGAVALVLCSEHYDEKDYNV